MESSPSAVACSNLEGIPSQRVGDVELLSHAAVGVSGELVERPALAVAVALWAPFMGHAIV